MIADATHGNYSIVFDTSIRRIFPKNRHGKSVPVTLVKHVIRLRHKAEKDDSNDIILSRYKHQGKWFWRDSRDASSCNRQHIVNQVQRMLKIDNPNEFVRNHLHG